ncbi:MAG: hypothetical protein ACOYJR_00450 [Acutalibacteraceae bacterium]|jgi:hypothetical protein
MAAYEDALKKQYEQQLQANRNAVEGSVRQAESALAQYAQQRENGARQAYVRMKQAEAELKDRLAETGINGGASETAQLRLKTQYGSDISALNAAYQNSANQVRQQVNALRMQGQKQEAEVRADYYAKLAQMSLQLQQAEAAAKAQAAKAAVRRVSTSVAASNGREKKSVQEQIAQSKKKSAKKAAAQKQQSVAAYVTVDGVKMTRQELEQRLESGSVEQDERGNYRFSYQRYPYWRHMTAQ